MGRILAGFVVILLAVSAGAYEGSGILWEKKMDSPIESLNSGGGLICAGLEDGRVLAVNPRGSVVWSYKADHIIKSIASPDGLLYASSMDGFIHALNESGDRKWVAHTPTYVSYEGAFDASKDIVSIGLANGILQAFDPGGRLLWSEKTDAYVQSVDVFGDSVVAVSDKRVMVHASDGRRIMEFGFPSYVRAADASEGYVAVALGDNQFMVYDLKGNLLVNRTLESQVGAVAVDSERAYAGLRDNLLRAFSLNGSLLWSANLNNSIVAVSSSGGLVACATLDNRLYILNADGEILTALDFTGLPKRIVFLEKHLIVGTTSGELADVILPRHKKTSAISLLLFTCLVLITSAALLIKSWRNPLK